MTHEKTITVTQYAFLSASLVLAALIMISIAFQISHTARIQTTAHQYAVIAAQHEFIFTILMDDKIPSTTQAASLRQSISVVSNGTSLLKNQIEDKGKDELGIYGSLNLIQQDIPAYDTILSDIFKLRHTLEGLQNQQFFFQDHLQFMQSQLTTLSQKIMRSHVGIAEHQAVNKLLALTNQAIAYSVIYSEIHSQDDLSASVVYSKLLTSLAQIVKQEVFATTIKKADPRIQSQIYQIQSETRKLTARTSALATKTLKLNETRAKIRDLVMQKPILAKITSEDIAASLEAPFFCKMELYGILLILLSASIFKLGTSLSQRTMSEQTTIVSPENTRKKQLMDTLKQQDYNETIVMPTLPGQHPSEKTRILKD